jgi:hypothetical protein
MKKVDLFVLAMLMPVIIQAVIIVVLGVGGFIFSLVVTLF